MSSNKEKLGAPKQGRGLASSTAKGKNFKSSHPDFHEAVNELQEVDWLIAQAQVLEPMPSNSVEVQLSSEPAGSVVYVEVPSQSDPVNPSSEVLGHQGQDSGSWLFSMEDLDSSLFGFLGVAAAGVIAVKETEKGGTSATSVSDKGAQLSVVSGDLNDAAQLGAHASTEATQAEQPVQSDVRTQRIDLSKSPLEPGNTVELVSGIKSYGKVVLTQTDVDNKFVDLVLSAPLSEQHPAQVVMTRGASTFVFDLNPTAGTQDAQVASANEFLAGVWSDTSIAAHAVTGSVIHQDTVL